ncbi:MAG: MBOAT family protein [Oscillospiraceae bacterium]|jgi:alginate O-acetyltransferase complex protein AlgI|nr:MBOAT family protein [Oscillospiraceae bacterium]
MLFSSVTFLYWFFAIVLSVYFLAPMPRGSTAIRNTVLLLASLVFYAWGEPIYVLLMLAQCFSGWFFGLLIDKFRGRGSSKAALVGSLLVGFGGLIIFKYSDFFINVTNAVSGASFDLWRLALPLGISFYTFQILSYTIDLYRGGAKLQKNFFTFSTYVMLFPQLVAGPIVRYTDVAAELHHREHTLEGFSKGAFRFVIGLGKKILIANVLGELSEICRNSSDKSVLAAWLYAVAYALHIYFDFSGYSDMAIGMGHIFGFKFLENFNYPYIAKSVTEFWRRWHMSLSTWFKDYVYIPLGGNRVTPLRHIFNIMLVWFLTGFWHGAGWNFILWGVYFGVILLIEKFALGKILKKLPVIISHIYVMLIVIISWIFFDGYSLTAAAATLSQMFGAGASGFAGSEALYYLNSYKIPLILGIIGSTPIVKILAEKFRDKFSRLAVAAQPLVTAITLLLVTAYLVDGSFNPFIYFRF